MYEVPTSYIVGHNQVITSLRLGRDLHLLCALISNYVYWMFFLVLSVHAMGCQETKRRDEPS